MLNATEELAIRLMASGLASSPEEAQEMAEKKIAEEKRADMLVLYSNRIRGREGLRLKVRLKSGEEETRSYIVNEQPYNDTNITAAWIPSGIMGSVIKRQAQDRTLVLGQLRELSRRRKDQSLSVAKLVAFSDELSIEGKKGIFFSPFSSAGVHNRGQTTIDEKQDLFRVEFEPIEGDYIRGMFEAWNYMPESGDWDLLLYMPTSEVVTL